MRAHAARLLGRNDETDDVVQDAFIAAWQQLPELQNPAALRPWLMRIVSFKSMDRVRARHEHLDITEHDVASSGETDSPEAAYIAGSRARALAEALSRLPPAQRRVWELKHVGSLSYEEIASQLEMPASTVRGLLSRARKTVVHEMEGWK